MRSRTVVAVGKIVVGMYKNRNAPALTRQIFESIVKQRNHY